MTKERGTDLTVKRRGFAAMSPERRKEIASRGGRNVPPEKRQFFVNRELALHAGRKGGESSLKSKFGGSMCREYRFLFQDHAGQDVLIFENAFDDAEAVEKAKHKQHGLAVEIWEERRFVTQLPASPLISA